MPEIRELRIKHHEILDLMASADLEKLYDELTWLEKIMPRSRSSKMAGIVGEFQVRKLTEAGFDLEGPISCRNDESDRSYVYEQDITQKMEPVMCVKAASVAHLFERKKRSDQPRV